MQSRNARNAELSSKATPIRPRTWQVEKIVSEVPGLGAWKQAGHSPHYGILYGQWDG